MSRRFHREVSLALFAAASAQGNIVPVVCPKTPVKSRSGLAGWLHLDLHAKKMIRRKVSSRLGRLSERRNLYIPIKPRDEATLGGMGFPRCVPTYEFQKKQKCFKFMIACRGLKAGHVATMLLEDRKTVTSDWHDNHCLSVVVEALCKRRSSAGGSGRLPRLENASAQTAAVALDLLASSDVQLVTHLP